MENVIRDVAGLTNLPVVWHNELYTNVLLCVLSSYTMDSEVAARSKVVHIVFMHNSNSGYHTRSSQ